MKKVLLFILTTCVLLALTAGIFVYKRWSANTEQVTPLPYHFAQEAPAVKLDAPILIVGDRMGSYFAKFHAELAATISQNLSKAITIQSLAKPGQAIHRTIHELRSIEQWPQIVIYQGGSEEFSENLFEISEIKKIAWNFRAYQDDRIQTSLILYPKLSRLIYKPIKRSLLTETPIEKEKFQEADYVARLSTDLLLYEQHLLQLVNMSRDKNSLLILTTTPINLDIAPKRVCAFTSNVDIEKEILVVEEAMRNEDVKKAYKHSTTLTKLYSGNAMIFYTHGIIAKKLNLIDEAKKSLRDASAFDCEPWRATEVQNAIIRRVAKNNQVLMFDFAKLVSNDWGHNITFFDEIYPQNLYYEKGMGQLGLVIKSILKL